MWTELLPLLEEKFARYNNFYIKSWNLISGGKSEKSSCLVIIIIKYWKCDVSVKLYCLSGLSYAFCRMEETKREISLSYLYIFFWIFAAFAELAPRTADAKISNFEFAVSDMIARLSANNLSEFIAAYETREMKSHPIVQEFVERHSQYIFALASSFHNSIRDTYPVALVFTLRCLKRITTSVS